MTQAVLPDPIKSAEVRDGAAPLPHTSTGTHAAFAFTVLTDRATVPGRYRLEITSDLPTVVDNFCM
jgi:hypothetical protein